MELIEKTSEWRSFDVYFNNFKANFVYIIATYKEAAKQAIQAESMPILKVISKVIIEINIATIWFGILYF